MLTPEEQSAFLQSVANVQQATLRHLTPSRDKHFAIEFIGNLQRSVSKVTQTAIEQGVRVACQPGCTHCCHARVEAMPPEIFRIARELKSRSNQELHDWVERLGRYAALADEAREWKLRPACPFLTQDRCAIYAVRPCTCRKAHSLDVGQCAENAAQIPQDLGIIASSEALTKGTSEAYQTLGFNAASYDLGRAILLALEDSDAESRWFSGERVFIEPENKD